MSELDKITDTAIVTALKEFFIRVGAYDLADETRNKERFFKEIDKINEKK